MQRKLDKSKAQPALIGADPFVNRDNGMRANKGQDVTITCFKEIEVHREAALAQSDEVAIEIGVQVLLHWAPDGKELCRQDLIRVRRRHSKLKRGLVPIYPCVAWFWTAP